MVFKETIEPYPIHTCFNFLLVVCNSQGKKVSTPDCSILFVKYPSCFCLKLQTSILIQHLENQEVWYICAIFNPWKAEDWERERDFMSWYLKHCANDMSRFLDHLWFWRYRSVWMPGVPELTFSEMLLAVKSFLFNATNGKLKGRLWKITGLLERSIQ